MSIVYLFVVPGRSFGIAQVLLVSVPMVCNLLLQLLSLLLEVWYLKVNIAYESVTSLPQVNVCKCKSLTCFGDSNV